MQHFKQLDVWQKSVDMAVMVYALTNQLPDSERFGLVAKINRAAISVASKIAEGSSCSSEKEYRHFLKIALGFSFQVQSYLPIVGRIYPYDGGTKNIENSLERVQTMLNDMIAKLPT